MVEDGQDSYDARTHYLCVTVWGQFLFYFVLSDVVIFPVNLNFGSDASDVCFGGDPEVVRIDVDGVGF